MSVLVFVVLLGFPAVGGLAVWAAAILSWRTARSRIPLGSDVREARGRLIPLLVWPSTLIVFGLVVSLQLLGEAVLEALAQPAALAYGVPGLLTGFGTAIIYRRGIAAAVASRQMFGRVLLLAVMPETSALFGLVVSLSMIRVGANPAGVAPFGLDVAWQASALAMVGGVGALVGPWLAASAWDFETAKTWPRALTKSGRGEMFTVACFAVAMAVLGRWLVVVLIAVYFAGTVAVGVVFFWRTRRKLLQGGKVA